MQTASQRSPYPPPSAHPGLRAMAARPRPRATDPRDAQLARDLLVPRPSGRQRPLGAPPAHCAPEWADAPPSRAPRTTWLSRRSTRVLGLLLLAFLATFLLCAPGRA